MKSICISSSNCKVSSVLNKNIQQFGKQNMFDGSEETCWNSEQGSPQYILINFEKKIELYNIKIMFQGGFVGKDCEIFGFFENNWKFICYIYPEDMNSIQNFEIQLKENNSFSYPIITKLKIIFHSSTDFYGRITIYTLEVFGKEI